MEKEPKFRIGDTVVPKIPKGPMTMERKVINVTQLGYILDNGEGIEMDNEDEWILAQRLLWHDAKKEEPQLERWILMADENGHYMAGQWQNDGKGFEITGKISLGPLKFDLPLKMMGDIVRWCYIDDITKIDSFFII